MPEGLSAPEVGKEIAQHARHHRGGSEHERRDRIISILEAVLLSIVTLVAAWSGYSAAKWNTESRVELAKASTYRAKAGEVKLTAEQTRNFDSSTFNTWYVAYAVGNKTAMRIAEHRFRPEFGVAFDAWRATNPETNLDAPRGPTFMPQYEEPGLAEATALGAAADLAFTKGTEAGKTSDDYIRVTVFLASVLFLIGLSTHFPMRSVRYGLVGLGGVLLVLSLVQLLLLKRPPA